MKTAAEMETAIRIVASRMNIVVFNKTGPSLIERHRRRLFGLLFPCTYGECPDHAIKRLIGSLTLSEEEGFMPSVSVLKNEDTDILANLAQGVSSALGTPVRIVFEK
jgi:hypothetical protein